MIDANVVSCRHCKGGVFATGGVVTAFDPFRKRSAPARNHTCIVGCTYILVVDTSREEPCEVPPDQAVNIRLATPVGEPHEAA